MFGVLFLVTNVYIENIMWTFPEPTEPLAFSYPVNRYTPTANANETPDSKRQRNPRQERPTKPSGSSKLWAQSSNVDLKSCETARLQWRLPGLKRGGRFRRGFAPLCALVAPVIYRGALVIYTRTFGKILKILRNFAKGSRKKNFFTVDSRQSTK